MTASDHDDLHDLRQAWQQVDRRLVVQHRLAVQVYREGRLRALRWRWWPLYGGQILQIAAGLFTVAAGGYGWRHRGDGAIVVGSGVVLHVYGLALVVGAARVLARLRAIDYAAPVVEIQKRLAALRTSYVRSAVVLGQAWWFLWMPCVVVGAAAAGVDIWPRAWRVFTLGTAVGIVGVLLTEGAARWSRRPGWEWLASLQDQALA